MKGTLAIGGLVVMLMGAMPASAIAPAFVAPVNTSLDEQLLAPVRLPHPGKTKCSNVIHQQGTPGSTVFFKWCAFSGTINGRSYEARRDVYRSSGGSPPSYRSNETNLYDCDNPDDFTA